ncbi:restriction endonuclease subunit S [Prevotella copri]|uniref:Restriction endonuclease subunit S n=1 Tax=Segatella copri TaxID=165179 RepID=A0AA91A6G1_9BACT|nr:restriction endonuclease subunit S [Segatella copri]
MYLTSDKPHYPFELPKGWCFTNIGELLINRDGERKPVSSAIRSKQSNKIYDYYGAAGVIDKIDDYLFDEKLLLIGEDGANLLSKSKNNAFFAEGKYWVNNHAHVLDATDKNLLEYVAIVINAIKLDDYITGSAQPKLSQDNLNKIPIVLPPLSEQKRIMEAIIHWSLLIEQIEQNKIDLQASIKQAKSKVLDLAIHGKLVSQDPNDEPASELLKRINPKAEITCDTPQYGKLPKGWCLIQGKYLYKPMKSTKPKGSFFNYIDIDSIDNAKQSIDCVKVVKTENAPSRASRHTQKGDIVFSMVRPYLKNIAIVPDNDCIASTGFYVCSPSNVEISKYCYYVMISDYTVSGLNQFMKGDNSPSINKSDIDNWLFPLPPLTEQHRIVAKIEELFAQLDKIEASL